MTFSIMTGMKRTPPTGFTVTAIPVLPLKNAEVLCGDKLTDLEREVIRRHMWPLTPTPPMKKEAFVVSMCDKYCATKELIVSIVPKQAHRFHLETGIVPSRPKA